MMNNSGCPMLSKPYPYTLPCIHKLYFGGCPEFLVFNTSADGSPSINNWLLFHSLT